MAVKKNRLKERQLKINLTDDEVERISREAGKVNLTVPELLENFIADLVGSNRRNGSDECDRADAWFERCWFSMFPEETFLRFMLTEYYSVSNFVTTYSELRVCEDDLLDATDEEEIRSIREDIDGLRKELEEIVSEYRERNPQAEVTLEMCAEQLENWMINKSNLKNGPLKDQSLRLNPLINVDVSLHFKIIGSVMFGGEGTEGYMFLVFDGAGNLEQFDEEHLLGYIRNIARMCSVPDTNVILISKEEYDLATGDSEESVEE